MDTLWDQSGSKAVLLHECVWTLVSAKQNQPSQKQTLEQTLIQWGLELGSVIWEKSGPDSSRQQVTCSSLGNAEWLVIIANTELYLFLNKYRI